MDELTRGTRCAKDLVGRDNSGFTVKGLMDIIDSLLKTGNKTANINVKKLQFIHTVNGDGFKTAKIIKRQC